MKPSIAIVDSGGANISSLKFALDRLGVASVLTTDARTINAADKVILPGVGAAGDAMQRLRGHGLVDTIRGLTQPVLGICLGMQLLAEASEEEDVECLGLIPGVARKLDVAPGLPVPNMGWCPIRLSRPHSLFADLADESYFYFVHSYALPVSKHSYASADHSDTFAAVIARENFVATQFHPERSSADGARILRNFAGCSV